MKTTILIIDDEKDFLKKCATALHKAGYECDLCDSAEEAQNKFKKRLYDGIVCDILIPFRGTNNGGLALAREFSSKYPSSCIMLVSQYVTAKWVREFADLPNHSFVEKNKSVFEDLVHEIGRIVKSKSAFICMPLAPKFEDFYKEGIKPVVLKYGYKCIRADEIEHNKGILSVIYGQIEAAHVVVADMTDRNPNVYYEIGYAHALKKEVILLIQDINELPFDLRGFNCIIYAGRLSILRDRLGERLKAVCNSSSNQE